MFLDPLYKNMSNFSAQDRQEAINLYRIEFAAFVASAEARAATLMHPPAPPIDPDAMDVDDMEAEHDAAVAPTTTLERDNYIALSPIVPDIKDLSAEEKRIGQSLLWWHRNQASFPVTSMLAEKYLVMQASEADVERNYSHAGHIFEKKRGSLSDKSLHMILFLYENRSYWENLSDVEAVALFDGTPNE